MLNFLVLSSVLWSLAAQAAPAPQVSSAAGNPCAVPGADLVMSDGVCVWATYVNHSSGSDTTSSSNVAHLTSTGLLLLLVLAETVLLPLTHHPPLSPPMALPRLKPPGASPRSNKARPLAVVALPVASLLSKAPLPASRLALVRVRVLVYPA
jgi:hypothetical protein